MPVWECIQAPSLGQYRVFWTLDVAFPSCPVCTGGLHVSWILYAHPIVDLALRSWFSCPSVVLLGEPNSVVMFSFSTLFQSSSVMWVSTRWRVYSPHWVCGPLGDASPTVDSGLCGRAFCRHCCRCCHPLASTSHLAWADCLHGPCFASGSWWNSTVLVSDLAWVI